MGIHKFDLGGIPKVKVSSHTKVFDLTNPEKKCQNLDDMNPMIGASGGLIDNLPVICGGFIQTTFDYSNECVFVGGVSTRNPIIMKEKRYLHSAVNLDDGRIWILGKSAYLRPC